MIQKLGKYSIVAKLGEGAMGAVYKAYDQILDRHVAIKTMAEDIKWDPELKLRFYREARSAASLHHPNIVTIHDLGEEGKITYIVMELLEGKEIKKLVQEKAPLPLEKRLSVMQQVADGLSHAHLHGIIHRDIKPGNIHLSTGGTVKILDFGIARIPSSDLTRSGVRLGTPIYMSPEQIRGGDYDERSDIFSTGIVFYELLTYVHPFRDKNIAKTLDNILFQTQLPFADQCPDAPAGLWPILSNCLAKEPAKRYPSMAELGRACRNLLSEIAEATIGMTRDLQSLMPRLRQAAGKPGAAEDLKTLLGDAETLLGGEEKPDYLALKRIMKILSSMSGVLQTGPVQETDRGAAPAPKVGPQPEAGMHESPPRPESTSFEEPMPADTSERGIPLPQPTEEETRGRELLSNGKALMEEGRFDDALEVLRQAMGLLGPRDEVVGALARTRQQMEELKRDRLTGLLDSARKALAGSSFDEAAQLADEALTLEANHTEAVEIRRRATSELDAERAKKAREETGAREKAAGMKLLTEGKYRDGLIALRRAADLLGEDTSIRSGIAQAEEAIRLEEIRTQAEAELTEARKLLHYESFESALSRVNRALEISPEFPPALELQKTIEEARAAKVREKGEADKAAGFKLLADKKFRESLLALRRASQILGEDAALQLGIEEAEEGIHMDELRMRVQAELEAGRKLLQTEHFSEARDHAQKALEISPKSVEARELVDQVDAAREQKRRSQEIAQLLTKGEDCFNRGSLDESEEQAREVLLIVKDNREASALLGRIDRARQQKVKEEQAARMLQQAEEALSKEDFREAALHAREILARDPQNPAAGDVLRRIQTAEKRKATEEQVAAVLEQAKTAMSRENLGEALNQAREALRIDPGNEAATRLLEQVEALQGERKQKQIGSLLAQGRQALGREDFRDASIRAQEILLLDPQNAEASNLLQGIEDARQKQRRDKVAGLVFECQKARDQGQLDLASQLARQALDIDAGNKEAKSLSKQIAREVKTRQKELKKQEKAAAKAAARQTLTTSDALGRTVILDQSAAGAHRIPPIAWWIGGGAAALVLLIAVVFIFLQGRAKPPNDAQAEVAEAQQLVQARNYDQAIPLLENILRDHPGNQEAERLLSEARSASDAMVVESLLIEAGSLRSEGKLQEALDAIQRILERNPQHEQALAIRDEIEKERFENKSREEQDKEIGTLLAEVPALIRAGRFDEVAKVLQRVLQIRPGDPEALRLRRQLDRAMAATTKTDAAKTETTGREARTAEMSRQTSDLIRSGKYEEAQTVLDRWGAAAPQDARYRELHARNSELIRHLRAYQSLMSERRYADALAEAQELEKLNSSDPNLASYRARAEDRLAAATAVLTVLRIGSPAQAILLDGQVLSTNGELEGKTIKAGTHKLTVKGSWTGETTMDFLDGQNYSFVYNQAPPGFLRVMSAEDRELVLRDREREKTYRWKVQHEHSGLFAGSCDGELLVSGIQVEYRPEKETAHRDVIPFQVLRLKLDGDKIELVDVRGNRRWQKFKVGDPKQVKEIQQTWDRLTKITK